MTIYCEPATGRPFPPGGAPDGAVRTVESLAGLGAALDAEPETQLVVLGTGIALGDALAFAAYQRIQRPTLGVVLIREQVALDVLAEAIRAGVREVVPVGDFPALHVACERSLDISRQLGATVRPATGAAGPGQAKVITVFGGKGGCGKSTVATNLAVTLAAGGTNRGVAGRGEAALGAVRGVAGRGEAALGADNRVLLLDLDLQFGDVAIMLQLSPDRGIADAIPMAGRLDPDGVRSLLTKYRPGVDTLLAPAGPAEGDHVTRDLIAELMCVAREMFDFIVIDSPPFFNDQVLAALDLTEWFVLVVTPDLPTLKSVRLTLDMFELLEYPAERRLALLNRADSKVGLTVSDIEKAVGMPMSVLMPSSHDVPVSVNRGVPITVDQPRHPVSRAIRELAERCAGASLALPTTHRRRLRVFGRRR